MFHDIGRIFTPPPRQAQSSDTRQEIKRHDPEHERRKKKSEHARDTDFDEPAELSIAALIAFLENITQKPVHDFSGAAQSKEADAHGNSERPLTAPDSQTIYASRAYGYAAQTRQTTPAPSHASASTSLSSQDVVLAAELLRSLKTLSRAGLENLTIQKNGDFMHSLQSAIAASLRTIQ